MLCFCKPLQLLALGIAVATVLLTQLKNQSTKTSNTDQPASAINTVVRQDSITSLPVCDVKPGSIYDGDTIRVFCNGQEKKIRFACVDAPEIKQEGGIESRDYLRTLLERGGMKVRVDAVTTDRYDRTVAELWVDQGMGLELVQSKQATAGMVWGYEAYKSDCKSWEAVASTQAYAQAQKVGIWASANPQPPWEWRKANK
ncbi:MAG: thermonuclease family protein [Symploca sp. SIO1C4]|uniref:Thermonuclease family protein n=1 Tax=Symploca sp. SIO1C4 TaxID=2607765 RepID=A0A6B3N9A1_9CYAN|nr:thermonuclease family protein [Symploca sp. SIO1C4]